MSSREKGVNVQVLLRCRSFSEDELRNNAPQVMTCNECQREVDVSQSITGKHIDKVFTFDKTKQCRRVSLSPQWLYVKPNEPKLVNIEVPGSFLYLRLTQG